MYGDRIQDTFRSSTIGLRFRWISQVVSPGEAPEVTLSEFHPPKQGVTFVTFAFFRHFYEGDRHLQLSD